MEGILEITGVPVIVSLVYFIITLYKQFIQNKAEIFSKLIPIIASVLGMILGVVAYYVSPEIIPASNLITAILIGGVSGLSATGANQVVKQFSKCSNTNTSSTTNEAAATNNSKDSTKKK